MKNLLIIGLCAISVTACGKLDRFKAGVTGELTSVCSDEGVKYYQGTSGLAKAETLEGKNVPCK